MASRDAPFPGVAGPAPPRVSLAGASAAAPTRAEAVAAAHAAREARRLERERPAAALAVQRAWRGARARRDARAELWRRFLLQYGAAVADAAARPAAADVATSVLPLALHGHLPPLGWRGALEAGAPLDAAALGDDNGAALRGVLALVLRSLGGAEAELCAAASASQLRRLALLCCAVAGSPGADPLLQAAAARAVLLLCERGGEGVRSWMAPQPLAARAAARLAAALVGGGACAEPAAARLCVAALGHLLAAQVALAAEGGAALDALLHEALAAPGIMGRAPAAALAPLRAPNAYARLAARAAELAPRLPPAAALGLAAALAELLPAGAAAAASAAELGAAAEALLGRAGAGAAPGAGAALDAAALDAAAARFARGDLARALLEALPAPRLAAVYAPLLALCDAAEAPGNAPGAASASARVLSALAFGAPAAPARLWRWLAGAVRLPLEVPAEARAFDVPSLPTGADSVPPAAAPALALFCRVHAHWSAVADDADFFGADAPLALPAQRAVALSLAWLVVGSQLGAADAAPPALAPAVAAALRRAAAAALRALAERDARRAFAPPALWLAPFAAAEAAGGAPDAAAAAAALLARAEGGAPPPGLAGLLLEAPACVALPARVAAFRALVAADRAARRLDAPPAEGGPRAARVRVRRGRLLEDALAALWPPPSPSAARGPLAVAFVSVAGADEAGVDAGGLTRELYDAATCELLDPDRGLFAADAAGGRFPSPAAVSLPRGADLLSLAGLLAGRALREGVLLDAPLAPFFVARLQGRLPALDDLAALDPELHASLLAVKRYKGDVSELGLVFAAETEEFGARRSEPLVPGGASVPVTDESRLLYVHLLADWHQRRRLGPAADAFARGLAAALPPAWLRLFSPAEVNALLGGAGGAGVLMSEMRRCCHYGGGYTASSRPVKLFWAVAEALPPADATALARFWTARARASLGGWAALSPPLTIWRAEGEASPLARLGGRDVARLPAAATCSNTLKLPPYARASTLRDKLLAAIHSGAGFELA
jgi:hypothetical protein